MNGNNKIKTKYLIIILITLIKKKLIYILNKLTYILFNLNLYYYNNKYNYNDKRLYFH